MLKQRTIQKIAIVLAILMLGAIVLIACGPKDDDDRIVIKESILFDRNARMVFEGLNGQYKALDGKTYADGDEKPAVQELAKRMGVRFDHVTESGITNGDSNFSVWQTAGFPERHYINVSPSNIALNQERFIDLSKNFDKMPNFKKFLDSNPFVKEQLTAEDGGIYYTPYFDGADEFEKAFMMRADWVRRLLDGEPLDASDIENNNPAHALIQTFYTAFLPESIDKELKVTDPATVGALDGVETLTVDFKIDQNIITEQNDIIAASTPANQGKNLVAQFRNYIDTAYNGYYGQNRSDLFIGADAAYNTDEMVALMRLVKANTGFLVHDNLPGDLSAAWKDKPIVTFFNRNSQNDRNRDIFRLAQIFGARGLDSRFESYYWDNDGQMQDAHMSQNTLKALGRMNQLYKEGLILEGYNDNAAGAESANSNATDGLGRGKEHRERLINNNLGFMIFEYTQTTLATSVKTVEDNWAAQNVENYEMRPVLPPFTSWDIEANTSRNGADGLNGTALTSDEVNGTRGLTRYSESWRGMNTGQAGAAVKTPSQNGVDDLTVEQEKTLEIMDYFWSEEGAELWSFGPDVYLQWKNKETGEIATLEQRQQSNLRDNFEKVYFTYAGQQYPVLAQETLDEAVTTENGSYTNYFRRRIGGTLPVGYTKQQAMEVQFTYGWALSEDKADPIASQKVQFGTGENETIWMNKGVANFNAATGDVSGKPDPNRTIEFAVPVSVDKTAGSDGVLMQNRIMNNTWPMGADDRNYLNDVNNFGGYNNDYSTLTGIRTNRLHDIIKGLGEGGETDVLQIIMQHLNRVAPFDEDGKPTTIGTYRLGTRLEIFRAIYDDKLRGDNGGHPNPDSSIFDLWWK